jgi:hypothetical protein
MPPSGPLTSLRVLVRGLPPATTRGTGGRKKKGERREEERKREGEGKGEERGEVGQRGPIQPSRLSSCWWSISIYICIKKYHQLLTVI